MSDWSTWTAAAFRGVSLGVDEWRLDAELVGVRVIGGLATAGPGVLRSPVAFPSTIRAFMTKANAPAAVADAVSREIWDGWKHWADGVTIPGLPWYPAFFAWPGPAAPPMPNIPMPLALCVSTGLAAMTAARLAPAIKSRMGAALQAPGAARGVDELSWAFHAAFMEWIAGAMVMMAFGAGPAPAYAPPFLLVAPVVGTVINNGRGFLASAIPFPSVPPPTLA